MEAVEAAGGKAIMFGTPIVSDGESQGCDGMRYSLPSRDLIADCIGRQKAADGAGNTVCAFHLRCHALLQS